MYHAPYYLLLKVQITAENAYGVSFELYNIETAVVVILKNTRRIKVLET